MTRGALVGIIVVALVLAVLISVGVGGVKVKHIGPSTTPAPTPTGQLTMPPAYNG